MSWDKKATGKSYYYRNKWKDGKAVKEYIGRGPQAEQAAIQDAETRIQKQLDQQHWMCVMAQVETACEPLDGLITISTLLTRSVLVANGCYLHKGHEWRKRRRKQHD